MDKKVIESKFQYITQFSFSDKHVSPLPQFSFHSFFLKSIMILVVQPKYGGMIIDIVSREIKTPEQQSEALDAIKDTILDIVLIVVIGYETLKFTETRKNSF